MKKLILVSSFAIAVALSGAAQAKVKPGLYELAGEQEICMVKEGTWFSPTVANWQGKWFFENYPGDRFNLVGNSDSGASNDSMTVSGTTVIWNQWTDDLKFVNPMHTTFIFLSKSCAAGLPANAVNKTKNPID